ncbi:hypothetical protein G436_3591 [Leptospira interrogans serovar Hardjo str. Norma]|uniref:Uncharacterized protein n=1 Tax=Leptospira interrogans serovar Hardjo str. Norma TaxID=1279460 RepID=A0A0M5L8S2_LEPIR|nr:hypothetical protein G436_3591 [Leptospira interrogans serovar Hardjo str. Norma]
MSELKWARRKEPVIHFSEKNLDLNFTDRFLKCGNYHKSPFYESVLKL